MQSVHEILVRPETNARLTQADVRALGLHTWLLAIDSATRWRTWRDPYLQTARDLPPTKLLVPDPVNSPWFQFRALSSLSTESLKAVRHGFFFLSPSGQARPQDGAQSAARLSFFLYSLFFFFFFFSSLFFFFSLYLVICFQILSDRPAWR